MIVPLQRVVVVGTSGSGKTTFAATLARHLDVPHIELDALHWEPSWTEATPEVFRKRVANAVAAERWVLDGNYSVARDIVWARADTIIWLDYALPVIMTRLVRRTARRVFLGELCCNGNRETLQGTLSRDSILLWALTTYRRRRLQYPELLARPQFAHLRVFHFQSPRKADVWLHQCRKNHDVMQPNAKMMS